MPDITTSKAGGNKVDSAAPDVSVGGDPQIDQARRQAERDALETLRREIVRLISTVDARWTSFKNETFTLSRVFTGFSSAVLLGRGVQRQRREAAYVPVNMNDGLMTVYLNNDQLDAYFDLKWDVLEKGAEAVYGS